MAQHQERDGRSDVVIDAEREPHLREQHLDWLKIWEERSSPTVFISFSSSDRRRIARALGSLIDIAGDSFHVRRRAGEDIRVSEALIGDWARVGEDLWSSMERLVEDEAVEP